MSANIHLSRRQFLQAGALLGGGLVLGFCWAPAGAAPSPG